MHQVINSQDLVLLEYSRCSNVIISAMIYRITGFLIVYATVCSGADRTKHQSSSPLAFVQGIHRWPVISPHKGPVTRKMFLFDDIVMPFSTLESLTHWGRDKKTASISQMTFSHAFWTRMYEFRWRFQWSLFFSFELTIFQHWFR